MALDVRADVDIAAPASRVFDYLADGENMPRWMKEFTEVHKVSEGPVGRGTEYHYHQRRGTEGAFEWSEFQPAQRLAWAGTPVSALPGGKVEPHGYYDINEHDGLTHVEMHMQPQLHGTAKLIGPMMSRGLRKGSDEYVRLLKAELER